MSSARWLSLLSGLLVALAPAGLIAQQQADAPEKPTDFAHQIAPILKRHCVTCHGGREAEGDFSLNTRKSILESGMVDLDNPTESDFLARITTDDVDLQMPPSDRPRVPDEEVAILRQWLQQGMPWEESFTFEIRSYEPPLLPRRPDLPQPLDGRTHPLDRILDHKLAQGGQPRPAPIDDATFIRRVYLDLVGLLPTVEDVQRFQNDTSPDKREALVDSLLADNQAYAEHWLSFYNDLLRNDYSGTGFITGGRRQISQWLYNALLENRPFDQFTRELIAPPTDDSRGFIDGIKWRGDVSAGQTLEIQFAQSVAQSFLGINMKCASCHDSFIDRWTLREAYGLGAIYSTRPLELHRCDKPTGEIAQAAWVFPEIGNVDPQAPRDQRLAQLADLMTHPDNGRFTRTIVNRLWYRLMGRGIVHPLDAMQNEPWSADLLDYLAVHLADNQYDVKATLRLIATSQAYQSQAEVVEDLGSGQDYEYRGPRARRMTAEQFLDAVWQLTGDAPTEFVAPVTRSAVPDSTEPTQPLTGQWIWADQPNNAAPAGERIALKTEFELDADVVVAAAVLTCDNAHQLFVNGRSVNQSDDWTKLQAVDVTPYLTTGNNSIIAIATNAGQQPNAAGFFFQMQIELDSQQSLTVASGADWQYSHEVPTVDDGRLGSLTQNWKPAQLCQPVDAWAQVLSTAPNRLQRLLQGKNDMMVRASLVKNTPLMQSLGRPLREQIVSMRPDQLTTLEAIDLANEPTLANHFAKGAQRWLARPWNDTDELIDHLFLAALARQPTQTEREVLHEALGESPTPESFQDAMWAVCMLPEFLLVR